MKKNKNKKIITLYNIIQTELTMSAAPPLTTDLM